MKAIARYLAVVTLALWIGGLSFYALVVVPVGTDVIGGTEQGFVTQRVTGWLNWIGVASLAVLLPSVRTRWMLATWAVLVLTLIALFALHLRLDSLLDGKTREVISPSAFYNWHRAYLIVTAAQWLAGVIHLWSVVQSTSLTSPDAVT